MSVFPSERLRVSLNAYFHLLRLFLALAEMLLCFLSLTACSQDGCISVKLCSVFFLYSSLYTSFEFFPNMHFFLSEQ